jgi:hypothetical protein
MHYKTGRPDTLEDFLCKHRKGQWFGFNNLNGDDANKTYANFKVLDGGSKPTEQECTDGLVALQTAFDDAKTKQETDKTNANQKLKDLGLTDDEITAITKG